MRPIHWYVSPDKVFLKGFEIASRSLTEDGSPHPGLHLLEVLLNSALGEAMRARANEWKDKGKPGPGDYFERHETLTLFPKLIACEPAVEVLRIFQISLRDDPRKSEFEFEELDEAFFAVEFMFLITRSIWMSLPQIEEGLRPVRQKGLVPQNVVEEMGNALLDWLRQAEAHLRFDEANVEDESFQKLKELMCKRGENEKSALWLISECVSAVRAQILQLMKPVEVE